jgi:hypothetical protein
MKRLIFSSLSILLLSAAILPTVKAEVVGSSGNKVTEQGTGKKNLTANDGISQILIAQNQRTPGMLMANADNGTPEGLTKQKWLAAKGEVSASPVKANNYTVTLKASDLVPNGLYTFWWVNKKLVGMDMGPAGGTPGNEFKADSKGNATATITVPANNNYQMLAVAYHADNQTHGQMPGEMGKVTFTHLMGNFPKPN